MSSYSTSKLPRIGCAAVGPGILEISSAMRRRRAMCTATGTIHESSKVRDHRTRCDEKGRKPVKVMGNRVASPPADMVGSVRRPRRLSAQAGSLLATWALVREHPADAHGRRPGVTRRSRPVPTGVAVTWASSGRRRGVLAGTGAAEGSSSGGAGAPASGAMLSVSALHRLLHADKACGPRKWSGSCACPRPPRQRCTTTPPAPRGNAPGTVLKALM